MDCIVRETRKQLGLLSQETDRRDSPRLTLEGAPPIVKKIKMGNGVTVAQQTLDLLV